MSLEPRGLLCDSRTLFWWPLKPKHVLIQDSQGLQARHPQPQALSWPTPVTTAPTAATLLPVCACVHPCSGDGGLLQKGL